ncbi:MAG TPA: hypothetical protein VIP54_07805, partial [Microterricola sp.]
MLALAARLRALTDEQLTAALAQREFPLAGVRDYFDLAEALLAPDSVRAALATLDRTRLAVLAVAGDLVAETGAAPDTAAITARISELGHESIEAAVVRARAERLDELLLGTLSAGQGNGDGSGGDACFAPFAAVSELMRAWPAEGLPSSAELATPSPHVAEDEAGPASAGTAASAGSGDAVNRLAAERAFGTTS